MAFGREIEPRLLSDGGMREPSRLSSSPKSFSEDRPMHSGARRAVQCPKSALLLGNRSAFFRLGSINPVTCFWSAPAKLPESSSTFSGGRAPACRSRFRLRGTNGRKEGIVYLASLFYSCSGRCWTRVSRDQTLFRSLPWFALAAGRLSVVELRASRDAYSLLRARRVCRSIS